MIARLGREPEVLRQVSRCGSRTSDVECMVVLYVPDACGQLPPRGVVRRA